MMHTQRNVGERNASSGVSNATMTRRVTAVIRGTLSQFANGGQEAACWSTQNGRIHDIMGVSELLDGTADQASATALLSNALLTNVQVLETKNDFPLAVGVSVSCVPNRECTRTGSAYAFSCLPETTNTQPLLLYQNETSTNESLAWRAQYPEYNSNNLETNGVLNVQGENFVFVSKEHPVIDLLRLNKDILNADIDQQVLIDDMWLKVTKQVMSTCCQQLKTKVLSKVGTCDLNQLSLQISRLDGINWLEMSQNDELFSKIPSHITTQSARADDMSTEDWQALQQARKDQFTQHANALINKPFSFHCRLQLQFELLPSAV